jgi:ABC-type bacteriocin/lantibiotic exporter with double-glycine peptidase domain
VGLILVAMTGCHFGFESPVTPAMGPDPSWKVVPAVPMVKMESKSDCGLAAVEMLLRYWRPEVPRDELRSELRRQLGPVVDDKGLEAGILRQAVQDRGLDSFVFEGTPDDLAHEIALRRPVIVGLVRRSGRRLYTHFELVVGVNERRRMLLAADPQDGWQEVEFDDFLRQWEPTHHLTLVALPRSTAQASSQ